MHALQLILGLFPSIALATVNGHCSGSATGLYKDDGICVSTANCKKYGGSYISGGCPYDADDIKCCIVEPANGGCHTATSYCDWTADACSWGSYKSGYCPGGSNYKCCVYEQ